MLRERHFGKATGQKTPPQTKNAAFGKKAARILSLNGIRAGFTCQFDHLVDHSIAEWIDFETAGRPLHGPAKAAIAQPLANPMTKATRLPLNDDTTSTFSAGLHQVTRGRHRVILGSVINIHRTMMDCCEQATTQKQTVMSCQS